MGVVVLAFDVFLLLTMGTIVSIALVAGFEKELKTIFSPSGRTGFLRILFGGVWLVDGLLRFQAGASPQLSYWMVVMAGQGQPAWLSGWYAYWTGFIGGAPTFWWYGVGSIELVIAVCLIAGFLRKPVYLVGLCLSLFLWTVPEGFGGPYAPGSTDMGAGILYAVVFLALLHLDSVSSPPRFALDTVIARRWPTRRRHVPAEVSISAVVAQEDSVLAVGSSETGTYR